MKAEAQSLTKGLRLFAREKNYYDNRWNKMPMPKDIGLGKHLDNWEKKRKKEVDRVKREERHKKISKKLKPVSKVAKKIGKKVHGKGISLRQLWG